MVSASSPHTTALRFAGSHCARWSKAGHVLCETQTIYTAGIANGQNANIDVRDGTAMYGDLWSCCTIDGMYWTVKWTGRWCDMLKDAATTGSLLETGRFNRRCPTRDTRDGEVIVFGQVHKGLTSNSSVNRPTGDSWLVRSPAEANESWTAVRVREHNS